MIHMFAHKLPFWNFYARKNMNDWGQDAIGVSLVLFTDVRKIALISLL